MKLIIFAGGAGTRLWPISRSNTPKQFDQFFDGKSTLQLAVERVRDLWGIESVYISTNKKFKEIVLSQIPDLPVKNLILEPDRRDLAAAVLLAMLTVKSQGYTKEIGILWADHLMDRPEMFQEGLVIASEMMSKKQNQFVYFGEKPRFANHNLGWIKYGREVEFSNGITVREFREWKYRPELELCKKMYKSKVWYWNTGYFVTSVGFVLSLYEKYQKKMIDTLSPAIKDKKNLEKTYPTLEAISFDDAIIKHTKPSDAKVLLVNLGWSDPGTLYALKEALEQSKVSNVTKGNVYTYDTTDSLVINYEQGKLVTTIGLKGYIVINMDDSLVVVHKDNVPKVKELVGKLKEDNDLKKFI